MPSKLRWGGLNLPKCQDAKIINLKGSLCSSRSILTLENMSKCLKRKKKI